MKVSSKVRCIDDTVKPGMEEFVANAYQNWVKEGEDYIVRDVFENGGIVDGIVLEGLYNLPIYQSLICAVQEPAFRATRFAELEEYIEEAITEESIMRDFIQEFATVIEGL
jgi:hypothetical protein